MDENKKDLELDLQQDAVSEPEQNLSENSDSVAAEVPVIEESSEESNIELSEDKDSTFGAEHVESSAALEELLASPDSEEIAQDDDVQGEEDEEEELDLSLATFAADCEMCATKVYFELEDLDEEGNLLCPNCNETIEIDGEAIDYYRVKKEEPAEVNDYVADCPNCEAVVHFKADEIDDEENISCPQCGELIHIETEVLDAYKQVDIEKALKKKKVLKKLLCCCSGAVLALALCFCVLWFAGNKSVIKIDGTSVPMNIYKCVYYIENAANYTSSGLDLSKKPSAQKYEGEEYDTWDDYLKKTTEETLKIYYGIYNAGKKDNFTIPDEDRENIETTIKNINTYAETAGLSFEDYLASNYGLKIAEKDFRAYLELSQYVNSYYKSVMAKDITEKQLKEIYDANPDNYDVVTFRYYYISIDENTTEDEALKQVEAIAAAKSEKKFHELVKKFISDDRADTYKEDDSTLVKDMACSNIQDRPVAEMLTDAKSKVGQVAYGVSDDGTYAEVAMLVSPRQKSDKLIKDAAINEIASEKGEKFITDASDDVQVKASIGSILRKVEF